MPLGIIKLSITSSKTIQRLQQIIYKEKIIQTITEINPLSLNNLNYAISNIIN